MNPVETNLLQATLTGDDASRDVYADWLEGQGDIDRAEFLRWQHKLSTITFEDARYDWWVRKLHALRVKIDHAWLEHVDPKPILPFEVELQQHLAAQPPVPVDQPLPAPPPPPPAPRRQRNLGYRFDWPAPSAPVIDTSVPSWIRISSTLAGTLIAIAITLYWLVT